MDVLVLGAGLMGVTTAWCLARDGHTVTVVDRADDVAAGTSHANAGLIVPSNAYSWAEPGAPFTLVRSVFQTDAPLKLRARATPGLAAWGASFLKNCTAERFAFNSRAKYRLSRYSQGELHRIAADAGIDAPTTAVGILYLFGKTSDLERADRRADLLRQEGHRIERIDAQTCVAHEPALAPMRDRLAGGLFSPTDESGDARTFTLRLAARCTASGVRFRLGSTVQALVADGDRIAAAVIGGERVTADAYVLALGCDAPRLAAPLGVRLPIYPVKGYSITATVTDPSAAPRRGGVDKDRSIAWSRMGDRIRITGFAEFTGHDLQPDPEKVDSLRRTGRAMFPGAADWSQATVWVGLRPMTPSGVPVLGRARHTNLWINAGQGHMGWTMSAGSARITADLIAGRQPAIDLAGMTLDSRN